MIEFLKNLFRKREQVKSGKAYLDIEKDMEEHFTEGELHIFVNRRKGIIRIDAPEDMTGADGITDNDDYDAPESEAGYDGQTIEYSTKISAK